MDLLKVRRCIMQISIQTQCHVSPPCENHNMVHIEVNTDNSALRVTFDRLRNVIKEHNVQGAFSLVVKGIRAGSLERAEIELREPMNYAKYIEGVHGIDFEFASETKKARICGVFEQFELFKLGYTGDYVKSSSSYDSISRELANLTKIMTESSATSSSSLSSDLSN